MVQGRITEADTPTILLGATPSRLISDPSPTSPLFMPDAFPVATLPLYPGLRQAPNVLSCILSVVLIPSGVFLFLLDHTQQFYGPFFRDHPGEPVPEEDFWTLWCKGRLTEADTLTIRLCTTPSGLTSAHLHHPPYFLQAGCPSCRPTNSVKALKANCFC